MNRGLASLGLAPTANHGHFWDTAGGANPSPTRWTVANPAAEDGRPQRAAPTAVSEPRMVPEERQAPVPWLRRPPYHA